jgi:uncharacterized membrane protein YvbJ
MKKNGLYIVLSILIATFISVAAYASTPNDTVLNYFQALKNGDVGTIKELIAGELYEKRKVLLEQNENYSEFLKKNYQYFEVEITGTTINDNDAQINAEVNSPDGKRPFTLFLKIDDLGNWIIFNEISEP